jgi:hypothetical protein
MKKVIVLIVTMTVLLVSGCGGSPASDVEESSAPVVKETEEPASADVAQVEVSSDAAENETVKSPDDGRESEPFPTEWIGTWICATSENMPVEEGAIIEFFENDNKMTVDDDTWWVYYEPSFKLFQMYLQEDFVEGAHIYEFDIVKQSESQIVFNDPIMGYELIFEKQ